MAKDAAVPAPAAPAGRVSEHDYETLLATLSASTLGRAFLDEFSRRQRLAETKTLLAAVARLEAMIAAQKAVPAETARTIPLHLAVVPAQPAPPVAAVASEPAQANAPPIIDSRPEPEPEPAAETTAGPAPAAPPVPVEDAVPATRAADRMMPVSIAGIQEVTWFPEAPAAGKPAADAPAPQVADDQVAAGTDQPATAADTAPAEAAPAEPSPLSAYEQLMILTDEERIALFS